MPPFDRSACIETLLAFVTRARRIEQHSLVRDEEVFGQLLKISMKIEVERGRTYLVRRLANEELVESLAARVRPLILQNDPVHYGKVLRTLGAIAHHDGIGDLGDEVRRMRQMWTWADPTLGRGMHFAVSVGSRDRSRPSVEATDDELAIAWFYGDVVHADRSKREEFAAFGINERFESAAVHVARIADAAAQTLAFIRWLRVAGIVALPVLPFVESVAVREQGRQEVRVYTAPTGSAMPGGTYEPLSPEWSEWRPGETEQSTRLASKSPTILGSVCAGAMSAAWPPLGRPSSK